MFSHDVITPPHPPSVNNNETFNVTPSSNQATSSRIQHHPTHFTWRYYTPPPPFCKQQRNFQRNTILQPSNIFQDSTSSNALHMTLLHTPPPPPPPPPISIQERPLWYSIKTEGSSKLRGTPSLEPIYAPGPATPPPPPIWDGSHILVPYEIFPLPPVVWWGCGMVWWVCMVCMVGLVWHVWKVWYVWYVW